MKKRTNKRQDNTKRIVSAIMALVAAKAIWGSAVAVLVNAQSLTEKEDLSAGQAAAVEFAEIIEISDELFEASEELDSDGDTSFDEIFDEFEDEMPEDEEEKVEEEDEQEETEAEENLDTDDDNSESEPQTSAPRTTLADISNTSDTEERIFAVMDYLVSEGFSTAAAAAIVGNMAVESQFNPSRISDAGYYGLFQWNTSESGNYWWNKVKKWLNANGYEWNSFEGQVKAFVHCESKGLLTEERFEKLKALGNVEEAVELIAVYYESCVGGSDKTEYYRAGNCYQELNLRKSEAWVAYRMFCNGAEYCGEKPYNAK